MLNRCDFRCVLKVKNVWDRRRSTGRLFQARGPAVARARSPVIERCVAVVTLYTLPRDRSSSRADVSRGGAPIGAGGSLFSSLLFSSLLFSSHEGQAAIKLPSAEASKRAQCTSPGQYTPYIKGIMKTPES